LTLRGERSETKRVAERGKVKREFWVR
jgi:hypothetical protein